MRAFLIRNLLIETSLETWDTSWDGGNNYPLMIPPSGKSVARCS
jgi:hypothetical protein